MILGFKSLSKNDEDKRSSNVPQSFRRIIEENFYPQASEGAEAVLDSLECAQNLMDSHRVILEEQGSRRHEDNCEKVEAVQAWSVGTTLGMHSSDEEGCYEL